MAKLGILNEQGRIAFLDYINEAHEGRVGGLCYLEPPFYLLENSEYSDELEGEIDEDMEFSSRQEMGSYLAECLPPFEKVSSQHGLWDWISLRYFDQLCPPNKEGGRHIRDTSKYVLSDSYSDFYRHLVRTSVLLYKDWEDGARLFLSTKPGESGDFIEQMMSRQHTISKPPFVRAAIQLYLDEKKGKPKTGAATPSKNGNIRRFVNMEPQLSLTYDLYQMTPEQIIGLLPVEFKEWTKIN